MEHRPVHQKVAGSIPSQGTHLGCRFDPPLGCVWEATNGCFSLTSKFLSLPPYSLSKIHKYISLGEELKKKNKSQKEGEKSEDEHKIQD